VYQVRQNNGQKKKLKNISSRHPQLWKMTPESPMEQKE
jgi:hypothetical protein